MSRRSFAHLALLLVACVGGGLVSCSDDSGPESSKLDPGAKAAVPSEDMPVPLRIQLNWVPEPEFGGLFAAQTLGYFREEGLDVELIKGGPGVAAPQLVASGQVEFAVVAGEQVLTLRDAGGDLVAVYASFQSDPMGIMVHDGSVYQSLEELWQSDVTIACEANLSFVAVLNAKFGGKNLRFVPYSGSVAQFAADPGLAQQCFVFAEPVALELQGIATRVFPASASGYDPYNVVIAASSAYARENPEVVQRLVRALQRGWTSYLESPEKTNIAMAKLNPAMSREAMDLGAARQAGLIAGADTERLGLGAMTAKRWEAMARQLVEIGKLKQAPKASEVFVWTPLGSEPEPDRKAPRGR
jgi:NitT/TauT family transport system substrate-binding protein